MPEWINDLIIAVGGDATDTNYILLIFKSVLTKIVDKAIDTSFEKGTIKLRNRWE